MRIDGDYESIRFTCESCGEAVTLNRVSDLGSVEPISGRHHPCPACGVQLWLAGDIANPAHELFIFEAFRFHDEKRYMLAISSMAQAWEMMLAAFLRFNLASRPYDETAFPNQDLQLMNQTLLTIFEKTRRFGFSDMLNAAANTFVKGLRPSSQADGLSMAGTLSEMWRTPAKAALESLQPASLASLFAELYELKVADLRNKVAHKEAYRPKREESQLCIDERTLLYRARDAFGMKGAAYFRVA